MKSGRRIILLLVALGCVIAAIRFGANLLFMDQWPMFDGLRQTAAIIFGLSGAYIAIVYPAALGALLHGHELETEEVKAFKHLLTAMELSFTVLAAVLFIGVLSPIVRKSPWCIAHVHTICRLSFAFAVILTILQTVAIICILRPLDRFTRDVERGQSSRRLMNSLPRQSRPSEPDDDDS